MVLIKLRFVLNCALKCSFQVALVLKIMKSSHSLELFFFVTQIWTKMVRLLVDLTIFTVFWELLFSWGKQLKQHSKKDVEIWNRQRMKKRNSKHTVEQNYEILRQRKKSLPEVILDLRIASCSSDNTNREKNWDPQKSTQKKKPKSSSRIYE